MSLVCSVVIPSYQRGRVALDSILALLALQRVPDEILLVDQTHEHPPEVQAQLAQLHDAGRIRWLRLPRPSIPAAMNRGLLEARGPVVLFIDDDIIPGAELVAAHVRAQSAPGVVAGQVLQPGQEPIPIRDGEEFRFNSTEPARVREFMGGNFSVNRDLAIRLGGFDENFIGAAFRFEAEFAHRYRAAHGLIRFEPAASIRHLAISSGGTRAHGHHLRTAGPAHSAGAYYFLLRTRDSGWLGAAIQRPLRAVRTRHHLRRPWWIPATLLAEFRGFLWARRLLRQGPKLIESAHPPGSESG
jgi:glycosyltransferase involved in cell wall biosynthesis